MTGPASGVHVRLVGPGEELAHASRLASLTFGFQAEAAARDPASFEQLPPGRIWYGAFDGAGRLIGTAADVCHAQWWGGKQVSAADVAAVSVAPEARGKGTGRALLSALLEGAYQRGAAVSALYPTVSAVYRASGWAVCGELKTLELPTAMLASSRNGGGKLIVRPADPRGADQPAIAELYTRLARAREGLLTREGPMFPPQQEWPAGIDGITLVEDARDERDDQRGGRLVGYASWSRGTGYGAGAMLDVHDLLATTPDAARELLAVLAGWSSVTPVIRLRTLGFDPVTPLVPWESAARRESRPWMHRPVDVARALTARGWPASRRGRVAFHLHDPVAPWNDGAWMFDVADGEAQLVRTATHPDLRLHISGLALLYCGVATPAMLVEAGLLHGPAGTINGMELLRPKSAAQLLDYF